jgi:hypothetical protein
MQFTSAAVALVAAFAMVEPIQAGGAIKAGMGIIGGILGGRDIDAMQLMTRDTGNFFPPISPFLYVSTKPALALSKSFGNCMGQAKEKLKVTPAGGNNFKLDAADGSMPPACLTIANSYMKTKMTDGKLSKAGNGYVLAVLPKDVKAFQS